MAFPRSHALDTLRALVSEEDADLGSRLESIERLTRFAVRQRYPPEGEYRPPTARAEVEQAVVRARDAVAATLERVVSPD